MKRILIPAGGALLATGLLAAGLAGAASADSDVASDPMATSAANAKAIAQFWAENNGAALKAATQSNIWDNADVSKLQSKGGYSADTKPGTTPPIGQEKKTSAKSQNVNVPKTIGKVFFVNGKGEKKWCSATSIQSNYRNLVATAGHCVYDTGANSDVMSKWVFVPGYYQGKAPWGLYVGKQAFTHYDFDVYEDYDRDYAFVTVYNGVSLSSPKANKVTFEEYKAATAKSDKTDIKATEVDEKEYLSAIKDPTKLPYYDIKPGTAKKVTGPDYPGAIVDKVEVTKAEYEAAEKKGTGRGQGFIYGDPVAEMVDKATYDDWKGEKKVDPAGNFYIVHYYIQEWYVPGSSTKYYRLDYYVIEQSAKDAGRLGDNVGGQGFAWNQPTGKYVRVFGYPAAPHPDGHKNYTGITPKWCYGKTTKKLVGSAAKKIEEHVALKCAMTEGADGGPWLLKYSNAKRLGYVNGVTSTFNDQDGNNRVDYISSPYFDGETAVVYKAAANSWSGKIL
ncbi:hypothetical protein AB0L05_05145 [Nonomuraea pusilla]|uniref:trypsin-like serine peptidase n=1 Tax=Nonomuraea pusilla TaxID=46177 RepID=UPI0033284834